MQSRPGDAEAVGVAGPTAAAFGEEHDRQPPLLGELEHAVLLAVVLRALRAGEHRVVVGHHDAARGGFAEVFAVHARRCPRSCRRPACARSGPRASAGGAARRSRAVRTRRRCPGRRGPRRSRAPCAGRSCAPALDRVGPGVVAADRVALEHLVEVRPDAVEVDRLDRARSARRATSAASIDEQSVALEDRVARARPRARRTTPLGLGDDHVLHLHRFHHEQAACPVGPRRPRGHRRETIVPCTGRDTATSPSRHRGGIGCGPASRRLALCRSRARRADRAHRRARPRAPDGEPAVGRRVEEAPPLRATLASDQLDDVLVDEARVDPARGDLRVLDSRLCRNGRFVATPSIRNSPSARYGSRDDVGEIAPRASARSAWRAASRSAGWSCSPRSRRCRRAAAVPTAARRR